MEEIYNENPEKSDSETSDNKEKIAGITWKQWLGTEDAIRWVYLIFGFFAIVLIMVLLQFSTKAICCGDWDGYYHIRWSAQLWESISSGHWLPEFKWLPLTVLSPQDYADHHFLFHLLQIPFLWFFEPVTAAKLSTVFYGSLAVFSVYWLMFRYKVDNMLLWLAAILACANSFYYRMNMAKAPPLTIIFTILGIYLLFERKYFWLLPLMFVFVWTYSLFPMLMIAAIFWAVIIGWNERKFEWKPLAYTGGGMILGNIINPYFPTNLWLFWEHLITKIKVGEFAVAVGGEWYPYSGVELLTHFPVALIAVLIGYILFSPRDGKLPEKSTFFLMFVTVLLVSQFRSKRFAEYFPPFAILFAAFSMQSFRIPYLLQLPLDFKEEIEPYLDKTRKTPRQRFLDIARQFALWMIGLILVAYITFNIVGLDLTRWIDFKHVGLITNIKTNEPNEKYQKAMKWANENIPENEIIFNCNWDNFPKMFFYDTKHRYAWGLDPNYLYSKNPELYKLMNDINNGKVEDPGPVIREKFGARFIFSEAKDNVDFIANCLQSGWCERAYEDDDAIILKIRDEKGNPDEDSVDTSEPNPEDLEDLKKDEENQTDINDEDLPDDNANGKVADNAA